MLHVLFGICAGSFAVNIFTFIAYGRAQAVAERQGKAFRYLRHRLNVLLDQWSMEDYCMHCKQFGVRHKLDCPQMTVRFAITKAEKEIGGG